MNLKAKHTPGPWKRDKNCKAMIVDAEGLVVGECHDNFTHRPQEECDANANLFAAAPALLEACKAAFKELGTLRDYLHITEKTTLSLTADYKRVYSALKKAIAKAEGENL